MDKQKQMIEEMEKTLYDYRFHYDDCIEGSEPNLAKFLVNRGWIKPDENAVVMTSEEWKQMKNSLYYSKEALEKKLQKARKETAERIMNDISGDVLVVDTKEYGSIEVVPLERLEEICDEFTEVNNEDSI